MVRTDSSRGSPGVPGTHDCIAKAFFSKSQKLHPTCGVTDHQCFKVSVENNETSDTEEKCCENDRAGDIDKRESDAAMGSLVTSQQGLTQLEGGKERPSYRSHVGPCVKTASALMTVTAPEAHALY